MNSKRREFLKNSIQLTAVAGASVLAAKSTLNNDESKDVLVGKSKKKEKLYQSSKSWEDYYKIAY